MKGISDKFSKAVVYLQFFLDIYHKMCCKHTENAQVYVSVQACDMPTVQSLTLDTCLSDDSKLSYFGMFKLTANGSIHWICRPLKPDLHGDIDLKGASFTSISIAQEGNQPCYLNISIV